MKQWIHIVIATVVVIGIGALGYMAITSKKSADAAMAAKFANPCTIAQKSDVDKAFGITFKSGSQEADSIGPGGIPMQSCKFNQATNGTPVAALTATNLTIQISTYDTMPTAQTALATTKSTAKIGDQVFFVSTDVSGVGDQAFFFQAQAPALQKIEEDLYARWENRIFHFTAIKVDGIDHAKAQAALTTLAKKALN